jgi:Methyltransferase domain
MGLDPRDPRFAARVRALDPWWFEFQLGGQSFGGRVPRDTNRVDLFFEWARRFGPVGSVLELGAHEGNHTLQIAGRAGVERVVALEGREDNVRRAQLVLEAFGARNVVLRRYDLERLDPAEFGRFDAVFCSGLLYHLAEPWTLVRRLAGICRLLFLDTHYARKEEDVVGQHRGKWYQEGRDSLSGLSDRSFWLTFQDLILLLMENGFLVRYARDGGNGEADRVWIFAEQVGSNGVTAHRERRQEP